MCSNYLLQNKIFIEVGIITLSCEKILTLLLKEIFDRSYNRILKLKIEFEVNFLKCLVGLIYIQWCSEQPWQRDFTFDVILHKNFWSREFISEILIL